MFEKHSARNAIFAFRHTAIGLLLLGYGKESAQNGANLKRFENLPEVWRAPPLVINWKVLMQYLKVCHVKDIAFFNHGNGFLGKN